VGDTAGRCPLRSSRGRVAEIEGPADKAAVVVDHEPSASPTPADLVTLLEGAVALTAPAELPATALFLSSLLAKVAARILQGAAGERWLTVEEAADAAQVPSARVRKWARHRDATWASRPTRKTLRIHEARFFAWISADASLRVPTGANRRLRAALGRTNRRESARM